MSRVRYILVVLILTFFPGQAFSFESNATQLLIEFKDGSPPVSYSTSRISRITFHAPSGQVGQNGTQDPIWIPDEGASNSPQNDSGPSIVGTWRRTDGPETYIMKPDGTAEILNGPVGRWRQIGRGKFAINWPHRPSPGQACFSDTITVAPDGRSFSGVNNFGNNVHTEKK